MQLWKLFSMTTLIALALFVNAACTPPSPAELPQAPGTSPTGTPPIGAGETAEEEKTSTGELGELLENREFEQFGQVIGTGIVPPGMASYRYNPAAALGTLFVKRAKDGAQCGSANSEDFILERIASINRIAECVPEIHEEARSFVEITVQGGADAKISHLVGEAGASAEFAFEFHVSNLASVTLPGDRSCFDAAELVKIPPPDRTCEMYYVMGAQQSLATFRQFAKAEGDVKYNTVINVEATTYGSTESVQSFLLLTVDPMVVGNWFVRDASGFLQRPAPAVAADLEAEIANLPEAEFIEATTVQPLDLEVILPELTVENWTLDESIIDLIEEPAAAPLDLPMAPLEQPLAP